MDTALGAIIEELWSRRENSTGPLPSWAVRNSRGSLSPTLQDEQVYELANSNPLSRADDHNN
jgi:hypothetical protein